MKVFDLTIHIFECLFIIFHQMEDLEISFLKSALYQYNVTVHRMHDAMFNFL